jgi:amino acid transporter
MNQASKFKTSGLLDIFSSLLTVMAVFVVKKTLFQNLTVDRIAIIHETAQFMAYSNIVELIWLISLLEACSMIFVSIITYIGHAKKILFGHCIFLCCKKKPSARKDMEIINLFTIVFLSVLFKITLIYTMYLINEPTLNLYAAIPNENDLQGLNVTEALYIGEFIGTLRWNNSIIYILLIMHLLYLLTYLAYLVYEALDHERKFSNFIARKLCCCCCLPLQDIQEPKPRGLKKKPTIMTELHDLKEYL